MSNSSEIPARKNNAISTRNEALLAWAIAALLLTVGTALGGLSGWIHSNLGFVAAVIFLLVPGYFLRKQGEHESQYGLEFADWKRGILWGSAATLLTIAAFSPLYHLWETRVQERAAQLTLDNYRQLPMRWYGAPSALTDGDIHVWTWGQQTHIAWLPNEGPWELTLTPESPGVLFANKAQFEAKHAQKRLALEGESPHQIVQTVHLQGAAAFTINASAGNAPLHSKNIRAGASAQPADESSSESTRIQLSYSWMLTMLLTQLILVAVPEEFFFRGYLQERLHQAWGREGIQVLGLPLTWGIVVSSVLFALVHLISNLNVTRLAVFFPSLLFGALRERTGGISASVLYHAACNLLVMFLSVHYF